MCIIKVLYFLLSPSYYPDKQDNIKTHLRDVIPDKVSAKGNIYDRSLYL